MHDGGLGRSSRSRLARLRTFQDRSCGLAPTLLPLGVELLMETGPLTSFRIRGKLVVEIGIGLLVVQPWYSRLARVPCDMPCVSSKVGQLHMQFKLPHRFHQCVMFVLSCTNLRRYSSLPVYSELEHAVNAIRC
jgi:hypothetical protein